MSTKNVPSDVFLGSILQDPVAVAHRLVVYTTLCGALYVLGYVVYQAFFHPLAKYPGPFICRFTNAHAGYHAWKGDLHLDMWRQHQKYGKFVRYAPDRLLIDSAAGLKDIYTAGKNVTKSQAYNSLVHRAPNTLTILDNKEHARRRRVLSSGFSVSSLKLYEGKVKQHALKLCQILAGQQTVAGTWSTPQNMNEWCGWFTFDIMADLVFGIKYNLLGNPKFRYVVDCICQSNKRVSTLSQMQSLHFGRLDKRLFPREIFARNRFVKFVIRCVGERLQMPKDKDVFSILTEAKDPQTGSGFTSTEIAAESTTLIVAGSDTSATLMNTLFFYLSRNPAAYARAAQEVRSEFSSLDEISTSNGLNNCVYLRACMDESMRISPPVGSALWREVLKGGAIIDGQHIPDGCDVGTGVYSIHHNPEYFPDPFTYRPERWLVGEGYNTREGVDLAHSAYAPFSLGPRGCIGKQLALQELMVSMAMILYCFDFKIADGSCGKIGEGHADAEYGRHRPDEFQMHDHITSESDGPFVQFRQRYGVKIGGENPEAIS